MTHSFMIFIMSALSFLIASQVVASAPPLQDFNQLYSQLLEDHTQQTHLDGLPLTSVVFDWFEEDFDALGGVASFIRSYRPDLPQGWEIVADLNYNWGINSELNARLLRKMRDDF